MAWISDSLLDIANLSGFNCSADSDGLLEDLKIEKEPIKDARNNSGENTNGSPIKTTPEQKKPLSTKDHLVVETPINRNGEESVIREKKRRDSVNSKLLRLSMLRMSPPTPNGPNATSKYIPTPLTTPASTTNRRQSLQYV